MHSLVIVALAGLASGFAGETGDQADAEKPLRFWVERLTHEDAGVRARSAEVLHARLGPYEEVFEGPFWHEDDALATLRREAKPLIPVIVKALRSADEEAVGAAGTLLSILGPAAEAAVPEMERLVLDAGASSLTGQITFYALLYVAPEDKPLTPLLLKHIEMLPEMEKKGLHEMWKMISADYQRRLKGEVAGQPNQASEPLPGASFGLTVTTLGILFGGTGRTKVEVPHLAKAITVLSQMEVEARGAVPVLRGLLKDPDDLLRYYAASALVSIEQDPAAISELAREAGMTAELKREFEEVSRDYFAQEAKEKENLRNGVDESSLSMIIEMLKYGRGVHRRQALAALKEIGLAGAAAAPEIIKALDDRDEDTRRLAVEALWATDPETAAWLRRAGRAGGAVGPRRARVSAAERRTSRYSSARAAARGAVVIPFQNAFSRGATGLR